MPTEVVAGAAPGAAAAGGAAADGEVAPSPITVDPPSREELLDFDIELREAHKAATLLPDGRSRRGRKTKHDTATRRWCERVGFPAITSGKRPPSADLAMLRLTPRNSLTGANLKAHDAWSQLHGRDPRSQQQTAAQRQSQQTLLAWAQVNLSAVGTPSSVRRGRVANYTIGFGSVWRGPSDGRRAVRLVRPRAPSQFAP